MNTRKAPCEECPWRSDIRPGQFPADRYEKLAETTGDTGAEAGIDAPLFACHKGSQDDPLPCAGWLAAVGCNNLRVRMLVGMKAIPVEALEPGEDWPPLFENYKDMAAYQAGPAGAQSFCTNSKCRDYRVAQTVVGGYPCPTCKVGTMEVYESR